MSDASKASAQVIVFRLEEHEYALPIEHVAQVLRMVAITPVPQATHWLPGVVNLRGRVIPVIDLRTRLGFAPRAPDLRTPIIVADSNGFIVGLIADAVSEVLTLSAESIEKTSAVATLDTFHPVAAIARVRDRLILMLDLEQLSAGAEILMRAEA